MQLVVFRIVRVQGILNWSSCNNSTNHFWYRIEYMVIFNNTEGISHAALLLSLILPALATEIIRINIQSIEENATILTSIADSDSLYEDQKNEI